MKNKIGDLNNHLFAQLERLSDEDIKGDELAEEIERSKAVTTISKQIISSGALSLKAMKFQDERMNANGVIPDLLQIGDKS